MAFPTAALRWALLALFVGLVVAEEMTPEHYFTFDFITNWTRADKHWLAEPGLWGLGRGGHFEPSCVPAIYETLKSTPQYIQTSMQMSTTLVTLIPTLLTIGNWNQAKSAEVLSTSFLVGISTAALSFALPARTRSGLNRRQRMDISQLSDKDIVRLRQFGERRKSGGPEPGFIQRSLSMAGLRETPSKSGPHNAEYHIAFEEMRSWSSGTCDILQFKTLSETVEAFRNRASLYGIPRNFWWIVPVIIFCIQAGMLLAVAVPPIYYIIIGWPIYDCTTQGVTWWVLGSVVVSVGFKLAAWEFSGHEIVKLHLLTNYETSEVRRELFHERQETVEDAVPPLLITYLNPIKIARRRLSPYYNWLKYLVKSPSHKIGSWLTAGRRKPAVIMVHLAEEARSPIPSFVSGFIQGLVLIGLTFFFGSFWAGRFLYTMLYMGFFLLAVFIGRVMGVVYVMWSEKASAYSTIDCHEKDEVRGILRILATMPNVMVEVNQRFYVDGRRIDDFDGFRDWLEQWEYGVHRSRRGAHLSIGADVDEKSLRSERVTVTEQESESSKRPDLDTEKPILTTPPPQPWASDAHSEIEEAARRSIDRR